MLLLTSIIPSECSGCPHLDDHGCKRHRGQEHRQHTRLGGCASKPKDRKVVEVGFVDPLKASKRSVRRNK